MKPRVVQDLRPGFSLGSWFIGRHRERISRSWNHWDLHKANLQSSLKSRLYLDYCKGCRHRHRPLTGLKVTAAIPEAAATGAANCIDLAAIWTEGDPFWNIAIRGGDFKRII